MARVNMQDYPDEVNEGYKAFDDGKSKFDNPYLFTDEKRKAWEYGFENALEGNSV